MNQTELNDKIRFVSHEIRNHISICDMYSQIIKRKLENENINNESITNAIDCIQKSLQIMGANLMDLKSLNPTAKKNIDFKTIVEKGISLSGACCDTDKNIEFEVFIKNSADICIDENRFLSCIINIIKNAIESIEIQGKITILGEVKTDIAILKISNNGKPIPKDKQEKIFQQGYTTKETGSGFGLNICKLYLESQNATIKLNKSNKSETQFEINIPIC